MSCFIKTRDPDADRWAKWQEHCVKVGTRWETRTLNGFDYIVLVPLVPFIEAREAKNN